MGRGTAYALGKDLDNAILDFTSAINLDSKNHDPWKRRGQTRAARGYLAEALQDMNEAINLAPNEAEAYLQRGTLYYNLKSYNKAIYDFTRASECDPSDKTSLNYLGLCLTSNGRCPEAVKCFKRVIQIDPTFKEAWSNMAQAYKDWGDIKRCEECFKHALDQTDGSDYVNAYYLRSLARYCSGNITGAIQDATKGCTIMPNEKNMLHMKALSLHAIGLFHESIRVYDTLVKIAPTFFGYHQREIAIHVHSLLDTPLSRINMDNEFTKSFKEAWAKRLDPAVLKRSNYKPQIFNESISDVLPNPVLSEEELLIIKYSAPFGARIQLKTPGFLPNKRQHGMCGFAVLEMAQVCFKTTF